MGNNVKSTPSKIGSHINSSEWDYIEENLWFYIYKERKLTRENIGNKWQVTEDRETLIRYLLLDYVHAHFSLYELFIIFFRQDGYRFHPDIIKETRKKAIENINNDDSFSLAEKKRIKRKVWDMNPLLFGLVLEFIHLSNIFWDYDTEDYVLPEFN